MEEFLKNNYFLFAYSVESLAAVLGVIFYRKYKHTAAKFLCYFLVYCFFVDLIGRYPSHLKYINQFYLIENTLIKANHWWYVIFWNIGLTSFITYVNYKISNKFYYKRLLKYAYIVYIILFIVYTIFYFKNLFKPSEIFLNVISLLMISMAIIIYFIEILSSDKVINFYKSIYFYVNSTLFLWSLITTPLLFYEIYFSEADWDFVILKWQVYLFANIFFYLSLSIALICCKPEVK